MPGCKIFPCPRREMYDTTSVYCIIATVLRSLEQCHHRTAIKTHYLAPLTHLRRWSGRALRQVRMAIKLYEIAPLRVFMAFNVHVLVRANPAALNARPKFPLYPTPR